MFMLCTSNTSVDLRRLAHDVWAALLQDVAVRLAERRSVLSLKDQRGNCTGG